jgi:hypothetical protein
VTVALALRHIEDLLRVAPLRAALFAAGVWFLTTYSFPFYHRSRAFETPHDLALADILADSYEAPNVALSYALCGSDYRQYRRQWTRDGALRTGIDLPLQLEGVPFEAAVVLADPRAHFEVFHGNRLPVPTRFATDAATGRPLVVFAVHPERGKYRRLLTLRFESPGGPVRVAALQFRPKGDDAWVRLPALLDPPTGQQGPTRRVRVARAGVYQLPICFYPGMRVLVNGRPTRHVSADRYLFTTHLEAGESVIQLRPSRAGLGLVGLGLAVCGAFAAGVFLRAGRRAAPPLATGTSTGGRGARSAA